MHVARQRKIARGTNISAALLASIGRRRFAMLQAHRPGWHLDRRGHRRGTDRRASRLERDTIQTNLSPVQSRKTASVAHCHPAARASDSRGNRRMLGANRACLQLRIHHWRRLDNRVRKQNLILPAMDGALGNVAVFQLQRAHTLWTNQSHKSRLVQPAACVRNPADDQQCAKDEADDSDDDRRRCFAGTGQLRI